MRGYFIIAALAIATASGATAADQQPICTDRPSKSTGECTVPTGSWQVETGLIDWTHDRSNGATTDFAVYGSSLVKYGISKNADLELGITPLEMMKVHGSGIDEHHSSFGDTLIRAKYRVTSMDAPVLLAIDPFVKLPTANHNLGNRKVEAGVVVATSAALGKSGLTLSLDPELDWVADADGAGHHAATQQVVNLGLAASDKVTLSTEIWARWDWDPSGTGKQASADGSVAYLVNNSVQIDAGVNFGLNRQTPDVEAYSGVSVRF
ncbi:MAG: transporter [Sphingomonas sp.]|nr:transporter [Sphingomonas sp.]MBW0008050.1 transporter [Sphingomonas sp.]